MAKNQDAFICITVNLQHCIPRGNISNITIPEGKQSEEATEVKKSSDALIW